MAGVAEVLAGLIGALVGAHLEVDDALAGAELLIGEVALVLLGGLGANEGTLELGVEVASTSNSHQALGDLGNVAAFVQIDGLEDVDFWNTPGLAGLLESVDVLHLLELTAGGVDLGDAAGHELVHEVAEDNAILENIFDGSSGKLLAKDIAHPGKDVTLELGITLASELVGDGGTEAV